MTIGCKQYAASISQPTFCNKHFTANNLLQRVSDKEFAVYILQQTIHLKQFISNNSSQKFNRKTSALERVSLKRVSLKSLASNH
tara:strand:+ start:2829 stop:3080 length:252 start_codon:yes stop_codon:yes gene_type:complete